MGGGSSEESERWGEGMVGGGSGGGRERKDKSTHQVHTLSELHVLVFNLFHLYLIA